MLLSASIFAAIYAAIRTQDRVSCMVPAEQLVDAVNEAQELAASRGLKCIEFRTEKGVDLSAYSFEFGLAWKLSFVRMETPGSASSSDWSSNNSVTDQSLTISRAIDAASRTDDHVLVRVVDLKLAIATAKAIARSDGDRVTEMLTENGVVLAALGRAGEHVWKITVEQTKA